jgi:Uma2 family endonuclease
MTTVPQGLSLADFVAWEATQETRHEYCRGLISAFPGGTLRHAALAGEIYAILLARLRGTPCRPFIMDVLTSMEYSARYPDVVVTCDERDTGDLGRRTLQHPKLIVEVLSESTASVDRGDKLDEYRSLESLEEYVLIDSRRCWAEAYRRADAGWVIAPPVSRGRLLLSSLGIQLDLDDLYANVGLSLEK